MITGIDKEIWSISIIDDEILWPVQINIMSYRENSWISVKVRYELKFPTKFNPIMLFGGFHLSTPVKWHENNGKVCEKRSELISWHFTNDDEILSIARFTREYIQFSSMNTKLCTCWSRSEFLMINQFCMSLVHVSAGHRRGPFSLLLAKSVVLQQFWLL